MGCTLGLEKESHVIINYCLFVQTGFIQAVCVKHRLLKPTIQHGDLPETR
jgi:hypothetical protein